MSGEELRELTIDVVSEEKDLLDGAFVSVLSDKTASHSWSENGSVTFTAPFVSPVTLTVHHREFIPRIEELTVSSKRLRRSIVLKPETKKAKNVK